MTNMNFASGVGVSPAFPRPSVLAQCRRLVSSVRALSPAIAIILIHGLASTPLAEEFIVRDAHGRRTETIEPDSGGGFVRRDLSGRRIGTVDPSGSNEWTLRDQTGRRTGSVERRYEQDFVVRDTRGRRTHTVEPTTGDMIIRDASGRRIGTVERR